MPSLSIIIPAYNEESRIVPTIEKINEYMVSRALSYELIIVDDGSKDNTCEVVENMGLEIIKLLKNEVNIGKGYSVKRGMMEASGEILLFTDADLSTPIEEYEKVESLLTERNDIVIGSRTLSSSKIERAQPWYRQLMGKTFNKAVCLFNIRGISDTQCGFKAFKRSAAKKIFQIQKIKGFAFDVEILFLAKKLGYTIAQVPVRWINHPDSKVTLIGSSTSMFFDLLRIRINSILGVYKIEK